ncbi:hypothetical protein ATEIFO6365_0006001100 [Aspergillus terreus]|uniref:Uncharacterized protein n=1 Tax=Aspergillus terreus TaxID=33178 RepID=A0A5M3YZS8_ASPTE|nr:hypothetical protein ATETN484_0005001000 [Aspergillus terreus]GFF16676.1 hypothetical protein ATEIFO6365_0006001100 [Aspergillus terreus]
MLDNLTEESLHEQPGDISAMALDDIYRQLHHLDTLEQSLTPRLDPQDSDEEDEDEEDGEDGEKSSPVEEDSETTRTNQILHDLHARQAALRDQATTLSRPSIRALTLLDLPNDLLCKMLDYFRDSRTDRGWIKQHHARSPDNQISHRTIQSARLVCRLFNDLATPLLCPILRVNLDQESLDRTTRLCRSPRVVAGVRAVLVDVRYCPQELAVDLARFRKFRREQLGEIESYCDWVVEGAARASSDGEVVAWGPPNKYEHAMDCYRDIIQAWNAYANDGSSDCDRVAEASEKAVVYQEILTQAHEIFRQRHQEQLQLLESQSYVRTLAACITMMPNIISLAFTDKDHPAVSYKTKPEILWDNTLLAEFMTTSIQWTQIEDLPNCQLVPARLLCDLPIAIHRAGVTLRDLFIGPFPLLRDYALLASDAQDDRTVWTDLRAACRSLRRASFGEQLNIQKIRHDHLVPDDKRYVDEYIGALLSSPDLEDVCLRMSPFSLDDGWGTKHGMYDISAVLAAARWPRIRRISIISLSLTQEALDAFCVGLPQNSMVYLHLVMDLLAGSWAPALDSLRAKLRPQATVYFRAPTGGEFEALGARRRVRTSDWLFNPNFKYPETPTLVRQAAAYLAGADMVNPLRYS